MPAPLGIDLRKRIISACKSSSMTDVAKRFSVSIKTVQRYIAKMKLLGHVRPKAAYQRGHSHKLTDKIGLGAFMEKNPTTTLKGISIEFGVSMTTAQRRLVELGITKKKELPNTWSETRKNGLTFSKKLQAFRQIQLCMSMKLA